MFDEVEIEIDLDESMWLAELAGSEGFDAASDPSHDTANILRVMVRIQHMREKKRFLRSPSMFFSRCRILPRPMICQRAII